MYLKLNEQEISSRFNSQMSHELKMKEINFIEIECLTWFLAEFLMQPVYDVFEFVALYFQR